MSQTMAASGGGEGAGDRGDGDAPAPSTVATHPDAQLPMPSSPTSSSRTDAGRLRARRSCSGIDGMDHQERFEELADKFAGAPASSPTTAPGGSIVSHQGHASIFAI